jgi:hypothetical protein
MSSRIRLLVVVLGVLGALSLSVGTASANRGIAFSKSVIEPISNNLTLGSEELLIIANVTITGSIQTLIVKTNELLIGYIYRTVSASDHATIGSRAKLEWLVRAEAGWHLRYNSFSGVLPNITGILATAHEIGVLARIWEVAGLTATGCLYRGNLGLKFEGSPIARVTILSNTLTLVTQLEAGFGIRCPSIPSVISNPMPLPSTIETHLLT